jgi:hypothetical protein
MARRREILTIDGTMNENEREMHTGTIKSTQSPLCICGSKAKHTSLQASLHFISHDHTPFLAKC